jgi:hypothetical protein
MFVANWPISNQQVLPTDTEWITSLQSAYAYHMSINLVFLPAPMSGEPILTTLILSANTIFCLWKGLVCRRWARHSPVSPCIFTRRGLWACSTATVQHPPGNLVAHSSCENLCGARCQALIFRVQTGGVPSPDFFYDVTAFKCMLHSRPYQHMLRAGRWW